MGTRGGRGQGSIPAGAGEPSVHGSYHCRTRVYPRGCGGARVLMGHLSSASGLSPRVRGSPFLGRRPAPGHGSIPAGAGEPGSSSGNMTGKWVYPRGCGGAVYAEVSGGFDVGLSPRVRGSRQVVIAHSARPGSIPAGAGEPGQRRAGQRLAGVYPRGCGGAITGRRACQFLQGLSPRVRGSRRMARLAQRAQGSIPAGAGEPAISASLVHCKRVYPRGCGGAPSKLTHALTGEGLSPRVRGSPFSASSIASHIGSIPAGAGEPHRRDSCS